MKKELIIVILLITLLSACTNVPQETEKKLSDFQITACVAADEAGTCDSRLVEVGIVLKEDCCQSLGKCCS